MNRLSPDVMREALVQAQTKYPDNASLNKCLSLVDEIQNSNRSGVDDFCQALRTMPDSILSIKRGLEYYKTVTFDFKTLESGEIDLYRAIAEDDTWYSVFDSYLIDCHVHIIPSPSPLRKQINFGYCLHCCLKASTTKYSILAGQVIDTLSEENWKTFNYHCKRGYDNGLPATRAISSWIRYEYRRGEYGADYDSLALVIAMMDRTTSIEIDRWFDQCLIEVKKEYQ